jgi:CheY-like chemotaxis protein
MHYPHLRRARCGAGDRHAPGSHRAGSHVPPASSGDEAVGQPAARPTAPRPLDSSPLVLVVDDEDDVRRAIARILERGGYAVVSVADGEGALAISRSLRHPIAVVLLDLTMPRIGGEQVLRELRHDRPDLPVLLMSGYTVEEVRLHFVDEAPTGFLQKPFSATDLLALVARVIRTTP